MASTITQGSSIIPSVRYRDAHAAIDWLCRAFGFTKQAVHEDDNGVVMHAQLTHELGMLMLGSQSKDGEFVRYMATLEDTGGRDTVSLCLAVKDCDAIYATAVAAGAEIVQAMHAPGHGGMAFACKDLEGHVWWIGTYDPWAPWEPAAELVANPYAVALGANVAREVIAETPHKLAAFLATKTPEELERQPAPGKWSLREIVAHLADCEIAFGFRLRQVAAGEQNIQPFDQDAWARTYGAYSMPLALATYQAIRAWNIALIASYTTADLTLPATHPERGAMTLATIIETMAGHDRHHLALLAK